MSDPLIDSSDLGTYLNDSSINEARANLMIGQAQALCESIVSPLPTIASVVVMRVAGRGYVTTTAARSSQIAGGGSPFGAEPGGGGGIYLTRFDRADLRRMAGGGNAYSINMLAPDYSNLLPPWDVSGEADVATS